MSEKLTRDNLSEKYPSNRKKKEEPVEKKNIEQVTTGRVSRQKRGVGKKLGETFLEDTAKDVGRRIFFDTLVPAAKDMICDIVGWNGIAEQILWGNKGTRGRRGRRGGSSHVGYDGYWDNQSRRGRGLNRQEESTRTMSRSGRAKHDFDDIVLETRGEADEVLNILIDLIDRDGVASVSDLYVLVGIKPDFTDENFGWTNLGSADVRRVQEGYLLVLPRTKPID